MFVEGTKTKIYAVSEKSKLLILSEEPTFSLVVFGLLIFNLKSGSTHKSSL